MTASRLAASCHPNTRSFDFRFATYRPFSGAELPPSKEATISDDDPPKLKPPHSAFGLVVSLSKHRRWHRWYERSHLLRRLDMHLRSRRGISRTQHPTPARFHQTCHDCLFIDYKAAKQACLHVQHFQPLQCGSIDLLTRILRSKPSTKLDCVFHGGRGQSRRGGHRNRRRGNTHMSCRHLGLSAVCRSNAIGRVQEIYSRVCRHHSVTARCSRFARVHPRRAISCHELKDQHPGRVSSRKLVDLYSL